MSSVDFLSTIVIFYCKPHLACSAQTGLRVHGYGVGWLGGWEYGVCTGGGWVKYMKAERLLKGLAVLFTLDKTDCL